MREAVRLPPGEDLNEWLAVNTVDFYNAISVLYSTLDECCTATTCPIMSAGPKVRCLECSILVDVDSGYHCIRAQGMKAHCGADCSMSTCGLMVSRC